MTNRLLAPMTSTTFPGMPVRRNPYPLSLCLYKTEHLWQPVAARKRVRGNGCSSGTVRIGEPGVPLDYGSPVPLYHQVAQALKAIIEKVRRSWRLSVPLRLYGRIVGFYPARSYSLGWC